MKKQFRFLAMLLLGMITLPNFAQTAREIFNSSEVPITYLGLDFTQAKLIGDPATVPMDVRDRHFYGINGVVIAEPKKYDFRKAFEKSEVTPDLSFVEPKNSKVDAAQIASMSQADFNRFTPATIDQIVKGYNFGGKKGVGLLFVVEALNKTVEQAAIYVTFLDMATSKVIFTERITGKPGGFGFRNYWARSVANILEDIQKYRLKNWKRQG
jgi:hypothetical protein